VVPALEEDVVVPVVEVVVVPVVEIVDVSEFAAVTIEWPKA
jgi:hypothetical protein